MSFIVQGKYQDGISSVLIFCKGQSRLRKQCWHLPGGQVRLTLLVAEQVLQNKKAERPIVGHSAFSLHSQNYTFIIE